jgi:hypothetical protein
MMRLFRFFPERWWSPKAWRIWGSYVHWRLETYGVYYPDNRFNNRSFRSLLGQTPSYIRWLAQFDRLRRAPSKTV